MLTARVCAPSYHIRYYSHINSLAQPLETMRDPEGALAAAGLPPLTFKPSRLKDSWPLAFLATNCHVQQVLVQPRVKTGMNEAERLASEWRDQHPNGATVARTSNMPSGLPMSGGGGGSGLLGSGAPAAVGSGVPPADGLVNGRYEWVTCGCPAAHAIKFRAGGLAQIDTKLAQLTKKLEALGAQEAQGGASASLSLSERQHVMQRREWLLFQRSQRLSICVSQALGSVITIVYARVRRCLAMGDNDELSRWASIGFLVGWESLLSTNGKEGKMLGDSWGAVRALRGRLHIAFEKRLTLGHAPPDVRIEEHRRDAHSAPPPATSAGAAGGGAAGGGAAGAGGGAAGPRLSRILSHSGRGSGRESSLLPDDDPPLLVTLRLPVAEFMELPTTLQAGTPFAVHVCLFTQGVNEAQTIANATGKGTGLQDTINLESLAWLEEYASAYVDSLSPAVAADNLMSPLRGSAAAVSKKRVSERPSKVMGKRCSMVPRASARGACRQSVIGGRAPLAACSEEGASSEPARGLAGYVPPGGFSVEGVVYLPLDACETDGDGTANPKSDASRLWEVRLMMAELRNVLESVEHHARRKETRVLTLSAQVVRLLHGGRMISCKSGKDRTSMSVTAEQVRLLQFNHSLPYAAAGPLLDSMRGEGCRMENTRKNVGKSGYAFNGLQRLLLPESLRPAAATTLAGLQS